MSNELHQVEMPDGRIDHEELQYRYEHIAPQYVARRVARQISGVEDLKSLTKQQRKLLGRFVSNLINEFGWFYLAVYSNQMEFDEKIGPKNLRKLLINPPPIS